MLHEKMLSALNNQINEEMYSSYLYLGMGASCERKGLTGFASWMQVQAQEELAHAMKIFHYISERMGSVDLLPIKSPPQNWDSPITIFEAVCEHEALVTEKINALLDVAITLKDHATNSYLQWYINEQVEEEATANGILDKLKLGGEDGNAILLLDKEAAQRVFVNPLTQTGAG